MIASPFKKINFKEDESRNENLNDIKSLQQQNNFTNQILGTIVTATTWHPKWVSSEGVTLRDCDSLTFSFSMLTPAFICIISKITKILFLHIHYTYHNSGIHYIVLLQFHYYKTIHIKSEICGTVR